jgi:hypothetical protein
MFEHAHGPFKSNGTITIDRGPNHYAFHSFSSGLDQFHYSDIIMTFHPT